VDGQPGESSCEEGRLAGMPRRSVVFYVRTSFYMFVAAMVFFTCAHCGESLKKSKVEKHYQTVCSRNPVAVTCVDCCKDFRYWRLQLCFNSLILKFLAVLECGSEFLG
jgi:hypothetical protein